MGEKAKGGAVGDLATVGAEDLDGVVFDDGFPNGVVSVESNRVFPLSGWGKGRPRGDAGEGEKGLHVRKGESLKVVGEGDPRGATAFVIDAGEAGFDVGEVLDFARGFAFYV